MSQLPPGHSTPAPLVRPCNGDVLDVIGVSMVADSLLMAVHSSIWEDCRHPDSSDLVKHMEELHAKDARLKPKAHHDAGKRFRSTFMMK